MKDKSIGLIKWRKAGLGNLFVSPCLKRRIRKKGQQGLSGRPTPKLTLSMKIAPTSHYWGPYSRIEDYGLKVSITCEITGRQIAKFFDGPVN